MANILNGFEGAALDVTSVPQHQCHWWMIAIVLIATRNILQKLVTCAVNVSMEIISATNVLHALPPPLPPLPPLPLRRHHPHPHHPPHHHHRHHLQEHH